MFAPIFAFFAPQMRCISEKISIFAPKYGPRSNRCLTPCVTGHSEAVEIKEIKIMLTENEIILYQPNDAIRLEVRLENESVWLNRNQMAILFGRDVKTIGKHIINAQSEELQNMATVAKFAIVQNEQISPQLQLDIQRHDRQYAPIPIRLHSRSHDRFLLIDDDVYHIGASIKDLGKRWFAIMKMQVTKADDIINHL